MSRYKLDGNGIQRCSSSMEIVKNGDLMKFEWRDYVFIVLGLILCVGSLIRLIVLKGTINHIVSIFLSCCGLVLFTTIYLKYRKKEE